MSVVAPSQALEVATYLAINNLALYPIEIIP
jgi:hypothetical protein